LSINSSDSSGSSSGSSSSGSSSGSNSGSGSSIDEEAIMDQIELDLHHERIARAWEIVNRRQAEWDGMEGIETSGVELGGIEMDRTGASLTDQGGQDSSRKNLGGRVSGRITIQGAGTSPMRTRSGKVVKHKDR
jgi:hypothetical protein